MKIITTVVCGLVASYWYEDEHSRATPMRVELALQGFYE